MIKFEVYKARFTAKCVDGHEYTDLETGEVFEQETTARMRSLVSALSGPSTNYRVSPDKKKFNVIGSAAVEGSEEINEFSLVGYKDTKAAKSGKGGYSCEMEIALVSNSPIMIAWARQLLEEDLPDQVETGQELRYISVTEGPTQVPEIKFIGTKTGS